MPGTGEAPLLIDIGSERMFSKALDYLQGNAQPVITYTRIGEGSGKVSFAAHGWQPGNESPLLD